MDKKNAIITILIIALIALAGWTYYTLTITVPTKAKAECEVGCKAKIEKEIVPMVSSKAEEACKAKVGETLMQLKQAPDCSIAIDQILAGAAAEAK